MSKDKDINRIRVTKKKQKKTEHQKADGERELDRKFHFTLCLLVIGKTNTAGGTEDRPDDVHCA